MKISRGQLEEIEFLSKEFGGYTATQEEIEEYINHTVHGKKSIQGGKDAKNRLLQSKRSLDIQVKMWREDITTGLVTVAELKEDFNSFGQKVIDSIVKSVTPKYRKEILAKPNSCCTMYAILNFPDIIKTLTNE